MQANDVRKAVWSIAYRPASIADTVLTSEAASFFQNMLETKNFMSLILSGPPGTGKTTVAKALVSDAGGDMLFLNGSGKDRGIDVVKNKLTLFAQTMSLERRPKFVVYDEADSLSHDAQLALRATIEEFASTKFILTCNFPGRLIEPLHSRFEHIRLSGDKESTEMKGAMAKRLAKILKSEGVEFDKKVLMQVVHLLFPDFRRTLNKLQHFALQSGNKIDESVLNSIRQTSADGLFDTIRAKDYKGMIDWVMTNVSDPEGFTASLWPLLEKRLTTDSYPYGVVFLNDVQVQLPIVADKHLALIAGLTKIMVECEMFTGDA